MFPIYLIIGILLLLGALLLFGGMRRLWRRAPISGSVQGLTGALLLALAGLAIAIAMNLYTYQILIQEQPVATVRFEALGPQYYRVYLLPDAGDSEVLELRGDQWQIDARVLKWTGVANLLGMKTAYRLERLSGRYRDIQQERSGVRTVYRLDNDKGIDLWSLVQKSERKLPWLDAVYGSAAYMPMVDKGQYRVTISNSGLVVRADNAIAQQAVDAWQ
ncbi:MAG: cation/multidrug efflux pump [Gammaproteobacteria bacterium]|nr:cation/multidrug efflux pump [Gammaproteobacteria bacterium]